MNSQALTSQKIHNAVPFCSHSRGILYVGVMEMFYRLRESFMRFMAGRYGSDKLNNFLFCAYMALWFIRLFFRRGIVGLVLSTLGTIIAVILICRTLSRNIPRRQAENERFIRVWTPIAAWFRRQFTRLRDIRRWRYRTCPYCNARLRLPILRGRRTVTCSRCHSQFKSFFL